MKLKYGPYSPSRLDTATCGYLFSKQYVEKVLPRTENLPQARGSAVHEVFEQITACFKENKYVFSDKQVRKWCADAVNNHPASYMEVDEVLEMAQKYISTPPAIVTEDAEIELKMAVKPLINEKGEWATYQDTTTFEGESLTRYKFVECDYEDPEAIGRGKADIFMVSDDTTTGLVYDHKTQPNIEEADTFQMGFYAWVTKMKYPFLDEIHTVLHFARYGKYSNPYVWTAQDLWKIEDQLLTRIGIIESRTFWSAVPYKNCQYCPIIAECPAMKEHVVIDETGARKIHPTSLKVLGDTHKAVKVAGTLTVMQEFVKEASKEVREHVKDFGPIALPGKVYEYRADEGIDWDKVNKFKREQVYAIFEKHDIDPKSFMSFNQTASKSVWMTQNENLVKELSDILPRKISNRFDGYKS